MLTIVFKDGDGRTCVVSDVVRLRQAEILDDVGVTPEVFCFRLTGAHLSYRVSYNNKLINGEQTFLVETKDGGTVAIPHVTRSECVKLLVNAPRDSDDQTIDLCALQGSRGHASMTDRKELLSVPVPTFIGSQQGDKTQPYPRFLWGTSFPCAQPFKIA